MIITSYGKMIGGVDFRVYSSPLGICEQIRHMADLLQLCIRHVAIEMHLAVKPNVRHHRPLGSAALSVADDNPVTHTKEAQVPPVDSAFFACSVQPGQVWLIPVA